MPDTDPRAWLAAAQERAENATEGPWAAWLDQDGTEHMHGMLMVGNAEGVIPDGEAWVEGVDVNPVAHTYTPEDREFIATVRTDAPTAYAALSAVLDECAKYQRVYDAMGGNAAEMQAAVADRISRAIADQIEGGTQ